MTTIRHVAQRAGVSPATVSHVINGTRFVSPELTARVREALDALSYQPDAVARSLRRRETLTIGLLLPSIEIPFFASITRSVEHAAAEAGYSVILCNSDWALKRERDYLRELLARRVDGLLCISPNFTPEHLEPVIEGGTPVVMVERVVAGVVADAVTIDNEGGAREMTRHLLARGHRRLGVIQGLASSTISDDRLRGVRAELARAGVPLEPALLERGDFEVDGGRRAAERLLALHPPPTAIFAFNDMMAIGALQAIHAAGLHVPEDVALCGFDGVGLSGEIRPPLTTMKQPRGEIGRRALELLLTRMRGEAPDLARHICLRATLLVRASTAGHAS